MRDLVVSPAMGVSTLEPGRCLWSGRENSSAVPREATDMRVDWCVQCRRGFAYQEYSLTLTHGKRKVRYFFAVVFPTHTRWWGGRGSDTSRREHDEKSSVATGGAEKSQRQANNNQQERLRAKRGSAQSSIRETLCESPPTVLDATRHPPTGPFAAPSTPPQVAAPG